MWEIIQRWLQRWRAQQDPEPEGPDLEEPAPEEPVPEPEPEPEPAPEPEPEPEPVGPFVRREIGALGSNDESWDPVMLAYARAVATMQARSASDPTSWDYQAGIHGRTGPAQPLFNQCEHSTWYFLPWHRMYLFRFEQIVRDAVVANGGPADWALPFWDYAANPVLPWVFRQATMPTEDGNGTVPNPLFVDERNPAVNGGSPMPASVVDSTRALEFTEFGPQPGSFAPTFGGNQTTPAHFGNGPGALEQLPHNSVHVQVGRPDGLMIDPNRAAEDPIFWCHHANIDRLWEVWNREGNATTDDASWNSQSFELFDTDGNQAAMTCGEVVEIESQLNYTYDGLPESAGLALAGQGASSMPSELIGGTDTPITVSSDLVHTEFELETPGPFGMAADEEPSRYILQLDNITGDAPPATSYKVMLDLGTPEDPSDDYFVGLASFFGVERASAVDGDAVPHGMTMNYDVTAIVRRLQAEGLWDGTRASVTLVPLDEVDTDATEISVGKVSIFVES